MVAEKPKISIVTSIVRDWSDLLRRFVGALETQKDIDSTTIEFTLVDGSGDPKTWHILDRSNRAYQGPLRWKVIHAGESCRAASSNRGIQESTGGLILLLADDFIASPTLVARHLELHRQYPEETAVAIGPGIFPPEWKLDPFMEWLEQSGSLFGVPFRGPDTRPPPPGWFYGANTSLKRQFFDEAGPFDEDYPYDCWDDIELGFRLRQRGMQLHFLPDAVALHWHKVTLKDRATQIRQAGESAAITDLKYGGTTLLRTGIQKRRNRRMKSSSNLTERWKKLLADEYNKAYKRVARKLLAESYGRQ